MTPGFKRVLLKLSGEALMGELAYGADAAPFPGGPHATDGAEAP